MTAVRRVRDPADVTPELRDAIFRRALEMVARNGEGSGFFVEVDDPAVFWVMGLGEARGAQEPLQ
jgi:hypothetical protein